MFLFQTVLVCVLLTIVHEAAHAYIGITFLGLTPEVIAIGIPLSKKMFGVNISTHLFTWKREGKPPVVISWLLIGGGVGFKNEDYYKAGKYRPKVEMLLAGPVSNILLGFITAICAFGFVNGVAIGWAFFSTAGALVMAMITHGSLALAINSSLLFQASWLAATLLGVWWQPVCLWLFWNFTVALFNLLPIPGLDGGHVILQGIQEIWGDKVAKSIKIIDSVFLIIWVVICVMVVFGFVVF